jgi:hypothetical protein
MSRNRSIRRAERQRLIVPRAPALAPTTAIPFIRSFPNGTTRLATVDRGEEMYALACQFIAAGGRYLVMKMPDESVELVAALGNGPGKEPTGVACETTEDGPAMLDAVDRLVRESVARLDRLQ